MADEVVAYEENRLNEAIGRGTIYRVLGIMVAIGLAIALVIGLAGGASIGLSDKQAFAMGGFAVVVVSAATLVLLFSLTGTIRYINREMEDLTRLRRAIEVSYAKLATSTQTLGKEIGELRQNLPVIRKLATDLQKVAKKNGRTTTVPTLETETTTET